MQKIKSHPLYIIQLQEKNKLKLQALSYIVIYIHVIAYVH